MVNSTDLRLLSARLPRHIVYALVALAFSPMWIYAQAAAQTTQTASPMKQFVIIFRQGPRTLSDADKARRQEEVSAWARMQNAAGHKLEPRILAPEGLRPGTESRAGSDVWPISALLFFEAGDLAEAAKVAEAHPAIRYGASIEVRPWAPPVVLRRF
ncbi:MAG TPA: hypothetical protein VIS96_09365 [Terrimicrobiaceae bacterium]